MKKEWFKPHERSKLGLDPAAAEKGKNSDAGFYEWLQGADKGDTTVSEMIIWLLDEFRENRDEEEIGYIIEDWKKSCDDEEFKSRLRALGMLVPADHPFHAIRKRYEPN